MNYTFSDKIVSLKPSAIREILKMASDPNIIPFTAGNPSSEAIPVELISKFSREILEEEPMAALQYSITEGYPQLRDALKAFCKDHYQAFDGERDELIITSGAQQAIELACKVLCNEGDVVLCENPSFVGSLNSFRSYGAVLKGVEGDEDGVDIAKLEQAIQAYHPKFFYVIPNFQNPTGRTMSWEKRKAVYELAKRYGMLVLEDNPYGDLRFAGEPVASIKSLDKEGLVIYCGSFSKILAPGLRVGFVSAPAPIVAKMTVGKQGSDVHTNILAQMIAYRFLTQVDLKAHFQNIAKIYEHKCGLMLEALDRCFDKRVTYTRPQGGLFIWGTLPEGTDMVGFCKDAIPRGVAVVPGTAFLADEATDTSTSFRMNFSTPSDQQIVRGVEILADLMKEYLH